MKKYIDPPVSHQVHLQGEGVEMGVKLTPGRGIEEEGEGEGERVRTPSRGNRGQPPSSSGGHEVYVPGGWEGV